MARFLYKHRRGTASDWINKGNEIIPLEGEIVIELDEESNAHKLKIGDGVHVYSELKYLQAGDDIVTQVLAKALPHVVTVELTTNWTMVTEGEYSQVVALDNITEHSRLDLQPSADMLAEFKQLGLVFVTENNGGTITVYSVGNMPPQAYTMQATIVETECSGLDDPIIGMPVGVPALGALASKDEVAKADLAADVQASLNKADTAIQSIDGLATEDYVDNKVDSLGDLASKSTVEKTDLSTDIQSSLNKADSAVQSVEGLATEDYVDNLIESLGDLAAKSTVEKSDLSADVQTSLNKANTALQSFTETDPTVPAWAKADTKPSYTAGEVGAVPTSRTVNGKALSANITLSASDVGAIPDTIPIPDSLADLTSDATHRTVTDTEKATWNAKSNFSGSYNDLTNKPTIPAAANNGILEIQKNGTAIAYFGANQSTNTTANITVPTKVSELSNDSNFASTTYVDNKVASIVDSSPETLDTLNELAAALGDDPNFATTVATEIGKKVDKVSGKGLSTNDYTTAEKNKLAGIEDGANKITVDSALSSTSTNPVQNKVINSALAGKADSSHNHTSLTGPLNITGTASSTAHLKFNRDGYNYITFPSSGDLAFATEPTGTGIVVAVSSSAMYPYDDNEKTLGTSDKKWSNVYATTFTGALSGNATSATKATQDGNGNNIVNTYATKSVASTSANGLMSSTDKSKLDGIASGAEVNQNAFSNVKVGDTTIVADAKTDTLTLAGSNVTITPDATNDKVTIGITKANVTSALGYTPPTTNTTYSAATQSASGLMSADDKKKLDGIASGANAYSHPTTSGNKHIPSGGSSGQILRWSADGTAAWGADNNTTYSAATQSAAGLMSATDKTKLDGIATGANKTTVDSALSSTSTNPVQNKVINSALAGKVGTSTTVNGHALTGNVTVTKSDVGLGNVDNTADSAKSVKYATSAGSAYSATTATTVLQNVTDNKDVNIWKVYSDNDGEYGFRLQYDASGSANNNSLSLVADNQTGTEVVAMKMLQDGTTTFAKAITASGGVVGNASSATKATQDASGNTITSTYATKTELTNGLAGKAASSHGTHVSYSTTNPVMDGTASVGSASTVARSDHKHPTDTSRAAASDLTSHTGNTTSHITSTERTNWNAAKTHADAAHAPSNAEKNQNAFSNIAVGSTTIAADSATDTLTLVAGSNVTITPDATNDKITIAATDTKYTHPSYTAKNSGLYKVTVDATGHVSAATAVTKADITALGIPGSDTNTDTKVSQSRSTTSNYRPLLMQYNYSSSYGTDPGSATEQVYYHENIVASPGTGAIKATKFVGALEGNATSATTANSVAWGNVSGKPSTFTPASHTQAASTITGLATVATSGSYNDLSNKPTIPTVNNATLTIQKNGTSVATFTANSSTNATANITVPTGAAADKGVDTSISAGSTSTNLPTSKAVAAFVEGKGYKTTDNNTTYTVATGDSNGQIKVTPSSGSAYNVSVKGLGSAAYTASTAYAPASHTHTLANVGITYGTDDLTAGTSALTTGTLYFVYE